MSESEALLKATIVHLLGFLSCSFSLFISFTAIFGIAELRLLLLLHVRTFSHGNCGELIILSGEQQLYTELPRRNPMFS